MPVMRPGSVGSLATGSSSSSSSRAQTPALPPAPPVPAPGPGQWRLRTIGQPGSHVAIGSSYVGDLAEFNPEPPPERTRSAEQSWGRPPHTPGGTCVDPPALHAWTADILRRSRPDGGGGGTTSSTVLRRLGSASPPPDIGVAVRNQPLPSAVQAASRPSTGLRVQAASRPSTGLGSPTRPSTAGLGSRPSTSRSSSTMEFMVQPNGLFEDVHRSSARQGGAIPSMPTLSPAVAVHEQQAATVAPCSRAEQLPTSPPGSVGGRAPTSEVALRPGSRPGSSRPGSGGNSIVSQNPQNRGLPSPSEGESEEVEDGDGEWF